MAKKKSLVSSKGKPNKTLQQKKNKKKINNLPSKFRRKKRRDEEADEFVEVNFVCFFIFRCIDFEEEILRAWDLKEVWWTLH